jgi:hypothetical protein
MHPDWTFGPKPGAFSDGFRPGARRDAHSKELHNAYEVRYAFVVGTALAVMPSAEDPFLISTSSIF